MYLVKPELAHEAPVKEFFNKCCNVGDISIRVAGSYSLLHALTGKGYSAWLERVRVNAIARQWRSKSGIEPGHTLLLVENINSVGEAGQDYRALFPALSEETSLVGIVTLHTLLTDADVKDTTIELLDGSIAKLTLALLPVCRSTANYALAVQDILAHIVCEGLPYKKVRCVPNEFCEDRDLEVALQRCNFDECPTLTRRTYQVDLRAAHQLRSRIQEYNKEG